MKAQLLMLGAAGLLVTAAHAYASPDPDVQAFVSHAQSVADAKLAAAGVALPASAAKVRGTVNADGLITGVHMVATSGSREADYAVEKTLRRLNVGEPPAGLIGAQLTLDVASAGLDAAHAR